MEYVTKEIHKFNLLLEANAFNDIVSAAELPDNPNDITRRWSIIYSYLDYFYIEADEITKKHGETVSESIDLEKIKLV